VLLYSWLEFALCFISVERHLKSSAFGPNLQVLNTGEAVSLDDASPCRWETKLHVAYSWGCLINVWMHLHSSGTEHTSNTLLYFSCSLIISVNRFVFRIFTLPCVYSVWGADIHVCPSIIWFRLVADVLSHISLLCCHQRTACHVNT